MIFGLATTIAMAQTSQTAQLDNLRIIINQLQEKIKGMMPSGASGIIKKIEKEGEKIENAISKLAPRMKPGKAGMNVEELGNGNIQVNLKNGVITEIDKANNILKVKIFGLVGKVHLMADVEILNAERANASIDNYAIGDYVNVFGIQDKTDPTLINAKIVRNVSLLKRDIENRKKICVQILVKAQHEKTGEIKEFPTPCAIPDNWKIIKPATTTTTSTSTQSVSTSTSQ